MLLSGRDLKKAEEAVQTLKADDRELEKQHKGDVVPVQIDVTDDSSIEKAVKWIESEYGRLNVRNTFRLPLPSVKIACTIRSLFEHSFSDPHQQRRNLRRKRVRPFDPPTTLACRLRHQCLRSRSLDRGMHPSSSQVLLLWLS